MEACRRGDAFRHLRPERQNKKTSVDTYLDTISQTCVRNVDLLCVALFWPQGRARRTSLSGSSSWAGSSRRRSKASTDGLSERIAAARVSLRSRDEVGGPLCLGFATSKVLLWGGMVVLGGTLLWRRNQRAKVWAGLKPRLERISLTFVEAPVCRYVRALTHHPPGNY